MRVVSVPVDVAWEALHGGRWAQLADRDPMHVHESDAVQHWQVAEVVAVDPVPWAGSGGVLPVETSRAIEAQL